MTIAAQKMTFDEFLSYDDGTDNWYELENGTLIAQPTESEVNRRIAMFLVATLLKLGISFDRLSALVPSHGHRESFSVYTLEQSGVTTI